MLKKKKNPLCVGLCVGLRAWPSWSRPCIRVWTFTGPVLELGFFFFFKLKLMVSELGFFSHHSLPHNAQSGQSFSRHGSQVRLFLSCADVFVHPYSSEGFCVIFFVAVNFFFLFIFFEMIRICNSGPSSVASAAPRFTLAEESDSFVPILR